MVTGPVVQLSTTSINFMQIDTGEVATRTVDIINTSPIDAVYQVREKWQVRSTVLPSQLPEAD